MPGDLSFVYAAHNGWLHGYHFTHLALVWVPRGVGATDQGENLQKVKDNERMEIGDPGEGSCEEAFGTGKAHVAASVLHLDHLEVGFPVGLVKHSSHV